MSTELTEVQKQEERVKAKQYAELMKIDYVDPYPEQAPDPNKPDPIQQPTELSNEQLLELLNKRTGATISSLEDLKPKPTADELAQAEAKRKTDMHVYGLTSGKFTQAEWDAYQLTLANKKDLVRTEITGQLKTAFPELAEDAIAEKVASYLFEHLEETDPLRVAREKEIMTLSDLKIKDKFKNIVNLPVDYDQYEAGVNAKVNHERKVQATLPVYKTDVKRALESLRHFTVEVPDSKNPANNVVIPLEYSDKDLQEVEELFLTTDQIDRAVKQGLSFDQIKGEADFVLGKKHQARLISQAAKLYNATQKENYRMARKGLNAGHESLDVSTETLKGELDAQYDEFIASAETPAKN